MLQMQMQVAQRPQLTRSSLASQDMRGVSLAPRDAGDPAPEQVALRSLPCKKAFYDKGMFAPKCRFGFDLKLLHGH